MILERTLPAVWALLAVDVPALTGRGRVVVVDDVETLCAAIVVEQSRSGAPYAPRTLSEMHDALGFALGRVVELLPRYDPTRGTQVHDPVAGGFKGWLHRELTCDVIDECRSWNGRNGQKRAADTPTVREENDGGRGAAETADVGGVVGARAGGPGGVVSEGARDRGDHWLAALRVRLLEGRDRDALWEVEALGLRKAPGARGGDPGADRPVGVIVDNGTRRHSRR